MANVVPRLTVTLRTASGMSISIGESVVRLVPFANTTMLHATAMMAHAEAHQGANVREHVGEFAGVRASRGIQTPTFQSAIVGT